MRSLFILRLKICCQETSWPNTTEAVVQSCSVKLVFLEILQNTRENIVSESFFNNVVDLSPHLKKDSGTGVFL